MDLFQNVSYLLLFLILVKRLLTIVAKWRQFISFHNKTAGTFPCTACPDVLHSIARLRDLDRFICTHFLQQTIPFTQKKFEWHFRLFTVCDHYELMKTKRKSSCATVTMPLTAPAVVSAEQLPRRRRFPSRDRLLRTIRR